MDPIGNPPLPWPIVIVGKLSMLGCILFFPAKHLGVTPVFESIATDVIGNVLALLGILVVILGFLGLGRSISVGLSREQTELKTTGVYAYTRNPLYFGGFVVCAGSCLYSIHPLNIVFFVTTVAIHHAIIRREEEFLEGRFGAAWRSYVAVTPRYVGMSGLRKSKQTP